MATTCGPTVIRALQAGAAADTTTLANIAAKAAGTAYAVDGALSAGSGNALLTKAGVGAYTLAAPTADDTSKIIINRTASAHVVTSAALVDDGVAGGSKTTMTFAAFAGSAIHLRSYGGKWNVVSKNLVTVA